MLKKNLLIILLLQPLFAISQIPPDWWEPASRQLHYPKDEWYVGFVTGEQQSGESLDNAYARLKDEARVEAVSSIRMSIEKEMSNSSRSELLQSSTQFDERITEVFESKTHISVELEVAGLKIEAWQNPKTMDIGAFAYVSRKELIRKTEKQITVTLTKIEMAIDNVGQMVEAGQKMKAREAAKNALPLFAEVEQSQKLLLYIDDDTESLQLDEMHSLQQKLLNICTTLQHGLKLYIKCSAVLGDAPFSTLQKELQANLSDVGCEFVQDSSIADWSVYVNANTRDYNTVDYGGVKAFTSYVDVGLSIDKQTTSQRIYEDEIHQKGTHTLNYAEAARSAYKDVVKNLSKTIKEVISQ
ncbi:MAG: hypothetical protein J6S84_06695 [Bacteroidales bacterium]|nr:hypothetical protein [Bacteroidales bacterium]